MKKVDMYPPLRPKRSDKAKMELVENLLSNGIDDYLKLAGEAASFEGFLQYVKEVAKSE